MKKNYLFSAIIIFLLAVFLGIWLCSILLEQSLEPEFSDPPMKVDVSLPKEPESSLSAPQDNTFSQPEPVTPPRFELSAEKLFPGDYLVIRAYNTAIDEITAVSPFSREPMFFESGDHLAALFPIKYTFEPGEYTITLSAGEVTENFTVELLSKEWQTQYLTVDSSTTSATINSSSANDEYFAKAHPKKQLFDTAPLWEDSFIQPVEGRITTQFGMQRVVNGEVSDRHGGVDIAAERGTAVKAANSGRVIFAEYIALTGNTVCIEHGLGLKTWYYHMDSLSVSEGDMVKKGEQIGAVGSTGFSTGPHLHWAAAVFDVYIDPWSLIDFSPEI